MPQLGLFAVQPFYTITGVTIVYSFYSTGLVTT